MGSGPGAEEPVPVATGLVDEGSLVVTDKGARVPDPLALRMELEAPPLGSSLTSKALPEFYPYQNVRTEKHLL